MISKLTGTDIGENQGAQYRTCRFAIRPRLKVAAFAHSIRHLCRKGFAALRCFDLGSNQQRNLSKIDPNPKSCKLPHCGSQFLKIIDFQKYL